MYAAHGLAQVLIRGRSDRAGVQNHDVGGIPRGCSLETARGELGLEGRAIGLRRPATEIQNVVTRQFYS